MKNKSVLAYILTRGRYQDYLPMAIMGVCDQTVKPDKLIIIDDNETPIDIRNIPVYSHLLHLLYKKGIQFELIYGPKKGQTYGHDLCNRWAVEHGYKFCWRLDDDNFPESNVLETLLSVVDDTVGAVGGSVVVPSHDYTTGGSGKIEEICSHSNLQWGIIDKIQEVDHLHCSFLYRAGAYQYNLGLDKVGHREETLFSYGIKTEGYRVLLVPCMTWHFRPPVGGTRTDENNNAFAKNEDIFNRHLKYGKIFVLDSGLGDHIVFKKLIPEIKEKYKKFTLAVCYPKVFGRERIMSIAEANYLLGDLQQYNPYHWATMNNYEGDMLSLFRKFYLGK